MATENKDFMSLTNIQGPIPASRRECSIDPLWNARIGNASSIEPSAVRRVREQRQSSIATKEQSGNVDPLSR